MELGGGERELSPLIIKVIFFPFFFLTLEDIHHKEKLEEKREE
jgi:hypothetical protein